MSAAHPTDSISMITHRVNKLILRVAAALIIAWALPAVAADCSGTVYLTIDTGSMSQADLIARVLKEENVKATFFIANERTVRNDYTLDPSWDGYWRALAKDGHVFGNHTWSHHSARQDQGDKVIMRDIAGKTVTLDQKIILRGNEKSRRRVYACHRPAS